MKIEEVRPAVTRFAIAMEQVLREHDSTKGKEGWKNLKGTYLMDRLVSNVTFALQDSRPERRETFKKDLIDIGNFAAMLYDQAVAEEKK